MPLSNFSYVIPSILAGAALPTLEQAQELVRDGVVKTIVSLREEPYDPEVDACLQNGGITCIHIPVKDFEAPSTEQMQRFADLVRNSDERTRPIVVHCRAGIGRTGTMLAVGVAAFAKMNESLRSAIASFPVGEKGESSVVMYMRSLRKSALEVPDQLAAFQKFEASLA